MDAQIEEKADRLGFEGAAGALFSRCPPDTTPPDVSDGLAAHVLSLGVKRCLAVGMAEGREAAATTLRQTNPARRSVGKVIMRNEDCKAPHDPRWTCGLDLPRRTGRVLTLRYEWRSS